jgi:hypothetical protein
MKRWLRAALLVVGVPVVCGPGTPSHGGTSDVYHLQTNIRGVIEFGGLTTNSAIHPVEIREVDLINLGLGMPLTTPVPKNERLALASQCQSSDLRIIIYDTSTSSNLQTIGYLNTFSVIEGQRNNRITRNVVAELTYIFSQNVSNGLAGGRFFVSGEISAYTNECLRSFRGQMTGALGTSFFFTNNIVTNIVDVTVTNLVTNTFYIVQNFTVNVANSKLSTQGKKLGILIEP